jgi:hypothetical protein
MQPSWDSEKITGTLVFSLAVDTETLTGTLRLFAIDNRSMSREVTRTVVSLVFSSGSSQNL